MKRKLVNCLEFGHVVSILDGIASRATVNRGLEAAGLDRSLLKGRTAFIPYAAEAVLVETVARAIGDRHLGARVGMKFQYSAYSVYASYVLSAPDLASALERGRRALYLIHPGSEILFRQTKTHLVVGRDTKGLSVIGHRHLDEGALFVIAQVGHHFLGQDWVPDWYEIPTSPPESVRELEELAGTKIHANAHVPGVAIRLSDLATVNPAPLQSDVALSLESLAALMNVAPKQTMKEAVVEILQSLMDSGTPDENSVAKLLAIGPRSLQRALRAEGVSFREIRTQVTIGYARTMLAKTDVSLKDVAKKAGYSDERSFRRAFKAATGQSPSLFRASLKTGAAEMSQTDE